MQKRNFKENAENTENEENGLWEFSTHMANEK